MRIGHPCAVTEPTGLCGESCWLLTVAECLLELIEQLLQGLGAQKTSGHLFCGCDVAPRSPFVHVWGAPKFTFIVPFFSGVFFSFFFCCLTTLFHHFHSLFYLKSSMTTIFIHFLIGNWSLLRFKSISSNFFKLKLIIIIFFN